MMLKFREFDIIFIYKQKIINGKRKTDWRDVVKCLLLWIGDSQDNSKILNW